MPLLLRETLVRVDQILVWKCLYLSSASIQYRGLKGWHTPKTPKHHCETLHKLGLQSRLWVMLIHEFRAEPLKIVCALPDNDERLRSQSMLP